MDLNIFDIDFDVFFICLGNFVCLIFVEVFLCDLGKGKF